MPRRVIILVALLALVVGGRPAGSSAARVSDKIAPWVLAHIANEQQAEMLVVLSQQADLSGADKLSTKLEKGRFVYDTLYRTAQSTQGPLLSWLTARGVEHRAYYILNAIWVKADRVTALALAARSDVARLDGNPQISVPLEPASLAARPAAPDAIEPGVTYIHAPDVWALGFTGQSLVIGGQDTGIQWDHPALKDHYRGWDGATANHDYNWHDSIHTGGGVCGANSPVPCDDHGHGTHTIGTAVGSDGGANQIGVAPGAKFIGCRNMNVGVGTPTTYLECFEFFLAPYPLGGTPAQGRPDLAPDVTNNSWSCPSSEGCNAASLLAAVQAQRAAGIMTVASAGNDGSSCNTIRDPIGLYGEVYTVGALNTSADTIASFSSRGAVTSDGSNRLKPDIAAPGTGTRSSTRGGSYGTMSGTSMASPHVAGAVALLWSARPELKNQIEATEQVLNDSAVHISSTACGSSGWPNNTYGYGRLDVLAAAQARAALTLTPPTGAQSATPGSTVTYTLRFTNTGTFSAAYGITLSGAHWPVSANLTTTGPISPGVGADVFVAVTVPMTATGEPLMATGISFQHSGAGRPGSRARQPAAWEPPPLIEKTLTDSAADTLTVTVALLATPAISATATFTTTALPMYGAAWTPLVPALSDYVGHAVRYTVRLTNTGRLTDIYTFSYDHADWPTVIEPSFKVLPPHTSLDVLARVTIPLTATCGQTDTLRLYATGATQILNVEMITMALTYRFFLPVFVGGN
jgi:serine protease AprX